ncbi:sigma-54 interaction domain-containing protein [Aquicella lusitana]|uniref:Two-component system response regulator FlrC n=1 Tax=Aquicella lusitana TaxID=254246 RepID=A0A370G3Q8_9COXI|nr:sigma-54 dependent transcriptional regulator [Aquicella lusitana]RDI38527.1 two-component system response regulator FlrC [Aquicella lusitana]VVC74628.1 Nitrogen fixation protein VnfA [Aquicella lusitana]
MMDDLESKPVDLLLIAEDPRSKTMLEMARKAAKSSATILINGETGVGKELIARYIHQNSYFSSGPYITVNCAALPENMIESMLFGYEKGAFTGAINAYQGKFEQANNGTLLLDEVTELPLALQAKLLRVLQERKVERLGGKGLININTRIIAATNRDIQQQVVTGNFRSDLYYRLNVIPVYCLPLRNRKQDIIPLTNFFIKKYSIVLGKIPPVLTTRAQEKILNYPWPGNIRELENLIHRTLIMTNDDVIDEIHIELDEYQIEQNNSKGEFDSKMKATEAKVILDVLKESDGRRHVAARKLNISPRTLRYKISKLKLSGIKVP